MQVTRRQIIQAAGGVGLVAAVPDSIVQADDALPLHRVVFDAQHEQSLRFAAEAQRLAVQSSNTRGDVAMRPIAFPGVAHVAQSLNAVDPDLTRFVQRGGKLLLFGGWNDTVVDGRTEREIAVCPYPQTANECRGS